VNYGSRKFLLAVLAEITCNVGLFMGLLGGGEWIGGQGVILGLYGAANVAAQKVG
jgi:hypothetical protein